MSQDKGASWRSVSVTLLLIAFLTFIVIPVLTEAFGRIEALIISVVLFFSLLVLLDRIGRAA